MKPYTPAPIKVPRFEEAVGFYTTTSRSKRMGKIKSVDTKPEILLRKALWAKGYRYRVHPKSIFGKPDILIRKYKLAIFVDGEFWHGYDWIDKKKKIKSNRNFWIPKIERNMQRDEEVNTRLDELGFTVIRLWAKWIEKDIADCVKTIEAYAHTKFHLRDCFDTPNDFTNFTPLT
ncbi:MAG: very short patch repair endonuclease [Bacteroidetes bacterium]|nr:very short patch repair endonuclease [Bacteroidota bacterium]